MKQPKIRFKVWLTAAALVFAAAWFVWVFLYSKPPAYTGPVDNISTGLIGEYASLILIADEQGYFKRNGLNVAIKEYPSGPAAIADLLGGKVDTAMGSDFAGVSNSFKGEDLSILATLSKSEAFFMVARQDHGIKTVADLKGKKIGITRKTVGEFYLGQFLIFNHLTLGDVRIAEMPQDALVKAVENGQIDAAVLFEPNAYKAQLRLAPNAVRWSVQSGNSIYSSLYSTGKFVAAHANVLERYMRALVEAENFVKNHNSQAQAIIAKRLNYNDDYINYIWPKFSFEARLDQELLLNMDDEARWAIENHIAPSQTPPNYLHLVYTKALEAVKPQGVTIIH
jgi:NitT/TauT family transport system substrate-binding protein